MKFLDFGDTLLDSNQCERIARAHWNNAKLPGTGPLRSPSVGETWPPEFMPHWRRFIAQRQATSETHFSEWATVRDAPFWKALARHIDDDTILGRGLSWAGMHGNLHAFEAASDAALSHYTNRVLGDPPLEKHPIRHNAYGQARIVHPDTTAFMLGKGLWSRSDAASLAQAYQTTDRDGPSILRIDPLMRGVFGFKTEFLADWCNKALQTPGWQANEQVQFLAHLYQIVDKGWTSRHLRVAEQFLHPQVDPVLLELSMGLTPDRDNGSKHNASTPGVEQLHSTVHSLAFAWRNGMPWSPDANAHSGFSILVDLMRPSTPLELYHVAHRCKQGELHPGACLEALALPEL